MNKLVLVAAVCAALAGCNFSVGTDPDENGEEAGISGRIEPGTANGAGSAQAMTRFVNSRENATSPGLQQHYVDFSFDYPSNWVVTPQRRDGTDSNYVRVAAPPVDNYEPYAFHVGHAYGSGNAESDRRDIEATLPQIARQFGSSLPNYQITSIGRDRVGSNESWNWRFSASAPSLGGSAPAQVYGRGDIILPPGSDRGVLLITLVTDRAAEVTNPSQVGEAGPVKAVFDSFTLGSSGAAK